MANFFEDALMILVERPELYFYILCGVWVLDLIFEAKRRKGVFGKVYDEDWDFDITTVLKILTSISCIGGIFFTFIGITGLILGIISKTVSYTSLIILGILTCLKPLNDLPIASILGILASSIVGLIMAVVIHIARIIFKFEISNIMLITIVAILIIVFIVVAIIAKVWMLPLEIISRIVSWPVVGIIGAGYCLIMGIILTLGIPV
ncbi:MAG: hypothetical protein EU541_03360 [Promethearchaeota archaeon]|nr:MAG: hypothetical protein EU541_03360 [Candidatus Lokiarchaeota archaeon]